MRSPGHEGGRGKHAAGARCHRVVAAVVLALAMVGVTPGLSADDGVAPSAGPETDDGLNCLGELTAGYGALEARTPELAAAHYRAALVKARHDTERFHAYLGLGSALGALGRSHEAVEALEEARTLRPEDGKALLLLGLAYAGDGQPDEAVATLEDAARRKPDLPEVHYNLGLLYERLGWHEQAASAERRVLRLDPGHTAARLSLAVALFHLRSYPESIEEFRRVVAADGENARAVYGLGLALLYAGDARAAADEQRRLADLDEALADDLHERLMFHRQ